MSLIDRIHGHFEAAAHAAQAAAALAPAIEAAAQAVVACLAQGGKVLACGHGASAANAQHFTATMLDRFEHERPGLAALTLAADAAVLTALVGEHGGDAVFARQVRALGQPGDLLLAISVRGATPGVVRAAEAARARGMGVIALTGRDGGPLAEQTGAGDVLIRVPSDSPARIQEIHLLILHGLCDAVDSVLLGVE